MLSLFVSLKRKCPHDSSAFFYKSDESYKYMLQRLGKRKCLVTMYSAKILGSIIKGKKRRVVERMDVWYPTSCIYHTKRKKRANEELSAVRLHEVGHVVRVTLWRKECHWKREKEKEEGEINYISKYIC